MIRVDQYHFRATCLQVNSRAGSKGVRIKSPVLLVPRGDQAFVGDVHRGSPFAVGILKDWRHFRDFLWQLSNAVWNCRRVRVNRDQIAILPNHVLQIGGVHSQAEPRPIALNVQQHSLHLLVLDGLNFVTWNGLHCSKVEPKECLSWNTELIWSTLLKVIQCGVDHLQKLHSVTDLVYGSYWKNSLEL